MGQREQRAGRGRDRLQQRHIHEHILRQWGHTQHAKDRHRFWGFATGLPATVKSIDGI